jgi:hypothetical protein
MPVSFLISGARFYQAPDMDEPILSEGQHTRLMADGKNGSFCPGRDGKDI